MLIAALREIAVQQSDDQCKRAHSGLLNMFRTRKIVCSLQRSNVRRFRREPNSRF